MAGKIDRNRPVRIAGASGSASDRRHAFAQFAASHPFDPVDVIIGDWMSEGNMTVLNAKKINQTGEVAYEPSFLESIAPALPDISKYGIKVAVNAGASDTKGLAEAVRKMMKDAGLENLKVAWIEGDDVLDVVKEQVAKETFENICTGMQLKDWTFIDEAIGAQAYLGGLGIAKAFEEGAAIVVCGRVSDASPVIAAAVWWHGWGRDQLHELANAFVAGHLIECSNYVCGGNFTGFKAIEEKWADVGYPIAEISKKGDVVITKQKGTGGVVTEETCKAQLLYEIQGPWYFNSDVTAVLDGISFEQLSTDRVAVRGVKADLPPPTTKIGITANGGYQAEMTYYMVGLDIETKARMLEAQVRQLLGAHADKFHVFNFTLNGTAAENPVDQNSATVDFRIFAQARNADDLAPNKFLRPLIDLIMCGYPGATFNLEYRVGFPKPIWEYYVTLLPQTAIRHVVHMHDGRSLEVAPPSVTKTYPPQQPSQPASAISPKNDGETVRGPLGWLVHSRSGDKGSNSNVGFWVRHADEYDWMRGVLSAENMKGLLAKEYNGKKIVCRLLSFALQLEIDSDRIVLSFRTYWLSIFFSMTTLTEGSAARALMIFLAKMLGNFFAVDI